MTDNQRPQASGRSPLDQYGNAAPAEFTAEPESTVSTKDAAGQEASEIVGEAAGGARNVVQTAKLEAENVASEAKAGATDLLHQATSGLGSQAGVQQQKAAEGVRTISSQLRTMADAPEQQGVANDLIRQAAERTSAVASWIEGKDPGTLLNDVQSFARRKPGTFLLLSAGAGVLAGRLVRGLQAGTPNPGVRGGVPPRPVQAPAAALTVPPWGEESLYQEQVATPATYGVADPSTKGPTS